MKKDLYPSPLPKGEKQVGDFIPGYHEVLCPNCRRKYMGALTSRSCKNCVLNRRKVSDPWGR